MPPDDPASNQLMSCVDGKRGYSGWYDCGETPDVEGPGWRDSLPYVEQNAIEINATTAVELALLHSPVYQGNIENLYLSALDVSFERFQFDTQLFGGFNTFFANSGSDRPGNGGQSSSSLDVSNRSGAGGTSFTANRLFATGAQLVVGFANSLMWEFSGPNTRSALTLIDFSLIQPLLRGGGRDIVLENLTFTERTLLANVRQMERFRRQFYVEVMTGRIAADRPIAGGVALGALNGLTDTSGSAGGYLGLLQAAQDIRNQRSNIASLQSSVAQLEAFFLAGRIDLFQVEFSRQALFNAQRFLLASERNLEAAKDRFKITLGLPPYLDLRLDDSLIAPFQLVDPDIIPLQNEITRLQEYVGEATNEIISLASPSKSATPKVASQSQPGEPSKAEHDANATGGETREEQMTDKKPVDVAEPFVDEETVPSGLVWSPEVKQRLTQIRELLDQAQTILKASRKEHVPTARKDNATLRRSLETRKTSAERLRRILKNRLQTQQAQVGGEQKPILEADIDARLPFDLRRLEELPQILDDTIADVVKQLDLSEEELDRLDGEIAELIENGGDIQPVELYKRLQEKIFTSVPNELNNIAATVLSLTLVQARARTESVTLPAIDMTWQEALESARCNRLDWMNARAALVDSWRNIRITANDLESQLDFVVSGDVQNVGDDSFDIRPSTGEIRVGLQFDAPLTRLAERNTYRAAQIAYQQARRAYYQFEDGTTASLRDVVRRLEINEINFELNRAGIEVAISQVELSRFRLQEPPKPNEEASFSPTTARDLVSALSDLLNVQNDFLAVWVSHEVLRRVLDLDMGTMQLDGVGLWIDPGEAVGRRSDSPNGGLPPDQTDPSVLPLSPFAPRKLRPTTNFRREADNLFSRVAASVGHWNRVPPRLRVRLPSRVERALMVLQPSIEA